MAISVQDNINREHDHGLLARRRQSFGPRDPGMLSTAVGSSIRTPLTSKTSSDGDGDAFQPLGACSRSTFRRSRVSECLLKSNLAEVKLLLLSCSPVSGGSAV